MRIGVIGAHATRGWARATHLPALAASPGHQVAAVASTSARAAAEAARVWGAQYAFDDPRKLISCPDVDLVTIAVQLPRRDGLVEAAIEAGKAVYCEWPLSLTAAHADHLHALAERAGVAHAVGLQNRHHPAIRYLRDLITGGKIGELLSASMTYSLSTPDVWSSRYADLFDHTKGVNHLAVVGGHSMDMFGFAVGHLAEVSATLTTRIPHVTIEETRERITVTSPDQIVVNGLLASGAAASVHIMTGGTYGAGYLIEAHGTAGRLVLRSSDDSLVGPEFTLTYAGEHELPIPDDYLPLLPQAPIAVQNVHQVYANLTKSSSAKPGFGTAARVHHLIDAIKRSAATGRRQRLRSTEE